MVKLDIALNVHDGVQALDVAGPLDVFASTNGRRPNILLAVRTGC
jgi:hypothetical protein